MGKVKYLIVLLSIVSFISGCGHSVGSTGILTSGASLTFTYENAVKYAELRRAKDTDSIHVMVVNEDVIRTGIPSSFKAKILEKKDNNICYVEVAISDGLGNEKMYTQCDFIHDVK
jgi:hypothetical protein